MKSRIPMIVLLIAAVAGLAACDREGPGDIRVLPAGKAVNLQAEAVPGKVTIYDFQAKWCGPCRVIQPKLEELAHARPDEVALRTVDVVSWESDAAVNQGIEYLPYLAIVDSEGTVVAEGDVSFDWVKEEFGVDLMGLLIM